MNESNTERWFSLDDAVEEIEKAIGIKYSVNKLINKVIEQSGYKNDHFCVLARWNNDLSSDFIKLRQKAHDGDELAQQKLLLVEKPIYYPKNVANEKRARMLADDFYSTEGENERFVRLEDKRGTDSKIVPARLWNATDNLMLLIGIDIPDTERIEIAELCMKPKVLKIYIDAFRDCKNKKNKPVTVKDKSKLIREAITNMNLDPDAFKVGDGEINNLYKKCKKDYPEEFKMTFDSFKRNNYLKAKRQGTIKIIVK